jgi:hypothetical protein
LRCREDDDGGDEERQDAENEPANDEPLNPTKEPRPPWAGVDGEKRWARAGSLDEETRRLTQLFARQIR